MHEIKQNLKSAFISLLKQVNAGADPDFIIIGAQKAGTTSLYNYLLQNPQILKSLKKEVHYFDLNFNKKVNWYKAHFIKKNFSEKKIIGEASPLYIYHPEVPARIQSIYSNIKIIILLRDPVERAISHYKHLLKHKLISDELSLLDVIEIEKNKRKRFSQGTYFDPVYSVLHRGEYYFQLKRWFDLFTPSQILILRSDQLRSETGKVLVNVEEFLNVKNHCYDLKKKYNVGKKELKRITVADIQNLTDHFKKPNQMLSEYYDINFISNIKLHE